MMKSKKIVKKLKELGYNVEWKSFRYWDNIPHIITEKYTLAIAETKFNNNTEYIVVDFPLKDVINAIEFFNTNPQFHDILKKLDMSLYYVEGGQIKC